MKCKHSQSGVGLIEVLVAALVFALGIAAVFQLQGRLFQSGSSAQARSIAMVLAEERLESLRHFLTADEFDLIDEDELLTDSSTVGNITFNRSWVVTDYCYNLDESVEPPQWTPELCEEGAGADQKAVVVTVTWDDTDGSGQEVRLEGLIGRGTPLGTVIARAGAAGGSGEAPIVPYTPSEDVQVTPIEVGDETKRETLIPSTATVDGLTRTTFVTYTYLDIGGGEYELARQEEFITVACNCGFDGVSTEENPTYAAAHATWNDAQKTYTDLAGAEIAGKAKGCVRGGGSTCRANPDPLCEKCCQDNHDAASTDRKYDPYRSTDDYTAGGNHNHYNGTSVVTSGRYLESCRMKRVDGYWRVYQDWNLIDFTIMPVSDLANPTVKQAYANYVAELIAQHVEDGAVDGKTPLISPVLKPSAIDHTVIGNYVRLGLEGDSFPTRAQLSARAVYLDYMDTAHLAKVQEIKDVGGDFLLHVPFYEVEIGPVLQSWTSDVPSAVRVIAGELHALATHATAIPVVGVVRKSNSALVALSHAVDYNASDNADDETVYDAVHVCVGCTAPAPPGSCLLPWGAYLPNGASVTAYEFATGDATQCGIKETRMCTDEVLSSGSFQYPGCTEGPPPPTTCTTVVTGKANRSTDSISLEVNDEGELSSRNCTVASNRDILSCTVTTGLDALIDVVRSSSGSVIESRRLSSICGTQVVNF